MSVTKVLKTVKELFKGVSLTKEVKELSLWTYEHSPDDPGRVFVPKLNPDFLFQPEVLEVLILAEVLNRPAYLFGHTGTGKTSHVVQFCAVRGKEIVRQNFDEAIGRSELIGSPTVAIHEGKQVVKFRRGSLVTSALRPSTYILDEYDMGTSGATCLINPILEAEADPQLYVPETEELIKPHRDWRIVATGNTDGVNPDERGIYSGAQSQNMATLNRFAYRIEVKYNTSDQEKRILESKLAGYPQDYLVKILKFVEEYRKAFLNTMELTIPFSTRMLHTIAETTVMTGSVKLAIKYSLLAAVPTNEKRVVEELVKKCGITD